MNAAKPKVVSNTQKDSGDALTTTSSRGNVIAPLQPGSICRVRSRNGKGLSDWSEAINLMAR